MVRDVFRDISRNYDFFDSLMSFGMDRRWRKVVVDMLDIQDGMRIMDVGAGSGKTIEEIAGRYPNSMIEAVDITQEMFPENMKNVNFNIASAESIPFQDGTFARIVSCFLTRNVESLENYFFEAYRCLEPGGVFCNLDIFDPEKSFIAPLFRTYFYRIMPLLLDRTSRSHSYSYLAGSVKRFISPSAMEGMLENTGFSSVTTKRLAGGTVYIHKCVK